MSDNNKLNEFQKTILIEEFKAIHSSIIAQINQIYSLLKIYLTIVGFIFMGYNYLVYHFLLNFQNCSYDRLILQIMFPFFVILISYGFYTIIKKRYIRFLDGGYFLSKIKNYFNLMTDERLAELWPETYRKSWEKLNSYESYIKYHLSRKDTFLYDIKIMMILICLLFLIQSIILSMTIIY